MVGHKCVIRLLCVAVLLRKCARLYATGVEIYIMTNLSAIQISVFFDLVTGPNKLYCHTGFPIHKPVVRIFAI